MYVYITAILTVLSDVKAEKQDKLEICKIFDSLFLRKISFISWAVFLKIFKYSKFWSGCWWVHTFLCKVYKLWKIMQKFK